MAEGGSGQLPGSHTAPQARHNPSPAAEQLGPAATNVEQRSTCSKCPQAALAAPHTCTLVALPNRSSGDEVAMTMRSICPASTPAQVGLTLKA